MILLSAHNMLAGMTKIPELAMDKGESDALAKGIANVAKHYDVVAMSEKTAAWVNLGQIAAMVYGPRFYTAFSRRKENRPKRQTPAQPAQQPQQPQQPQRPSDDVTPRTVDLGDFGL